MARSCPSLQDGFYPENSVGFEVVRDQVSALWHLIIELYNTRLEETPRSGPGASVQPFKTLKETTAAHWHMPTWFLTCDQ